MTDDQIKTIREYVFEKFVDGSHPSSSIDESAALSVLEAHHRKVPIAQDGDTYYLGILYFELAFEDETKQADYQARAKVILDEYRTRSGEAWDAVDDRADDAGSSIDALPAAERATRIAAAESWWKGVLDSATATAKAEEPKGPVVQDGMVLVPAGPFLSGVAKSARETKAFWIDLHPVTNAEYRKFVDATGYRDPKFWPEGRFRAPDEPVVGVSWYDAFKYAAFVGKSLPTKDQWEKAARGRNGRVYPWGDEFVPGRCEYGGVDGSDAIGKVGQHADAASEFGVQDMSGSVWEWTDSPDPNDSEQKIICGGSWVDDESFLRCDEHLAAYPKDKYDNIGFRCVRLVKE